ncbi:MAG: YceI family protein, partial [Candidatus Hydrogenedentes bacterium]|nr:YceI family protein [Candidatus Hydrogenedentota bacterium]
KYPTSTFKTTSIKPSASGFDVSGDLTIRDKTKNITFPATIALDGANLKVKAEFELNRNDFDIKYQGTVGDYVIQDNCPVKLDIVCVPAQ